MVRIFICFGSDKDWVTTRAQFGIFSIKFCQFWTTLLVLNFFANCLTIPSYVHCSVDNERKSFGKLLSLRWRNYCFETVWHIERGLRKRKCSNRFGQIWSFLHYTEECGSQKFNKIVWHRWYATPFISFIFGGAIVG